MKINFRALTQVVA